LIVQTSHEKLEMSSLSELLLFKELNTREMKWRGIELQNKYQFNVYENSPEIGIEIEVENINKNPTTLFGWTLESDGSLRNNGIEFVSWILKPTQIETAINEVKRVLSPEHHFSPRTSVHIHMNCRDRTLMQIYNIVLLYQCFEDLLFNFVGKSRKKSIFCTPVGNTNYYTSLKELLLRNKIPAWDKYTSLNLQRLTDLGTIEFRQLYGTLNEEKLYNWIKLLYDLYDYAIKYTTIELEAKILQIDNNENYTAFGFDVFNSNFNLLAKDAYQKHMMADISIAKLYFTNSPKLIGL